MGERENVVIEEIFNRLFFEIEVGEELVRGGEGSFEGDGEGGE